MSILKHTLLKISYNYTGAVHRFFESRRRLFNDDQPGRMQSANETKKNSKRTALRKQVTYSAINYTLVVIKYVNNESGKHEGQ